MASGMASGVAVSCIGGMIGKASFGAWSGTTGKLRLNSTASSETGPGTEISGGSYSAGGVALGTNIATCFGAASYSTGVASITNSGQAVSQANMPAVTTTSADIFDNGGTRWWWGDLSSPVTTNSGDTLTFNTSSITVQLNV